jgi:hypothetical protein
MHTSITASSLALEPAVIQAEVADVFNDQMKQLEQHGLDLGLVLGRKRQAVTVVGQHLLHSHGVSVGLAQGLQQGLSLLRKALVVMAQCRQGVLNHACHLAKKIGSQRRRRQHRCISAARPDWHQRWPWGHRRRCSLGVRAWGCLPRWGCEAAIGHQRALHAVPVQIVDGRLQQTALALLPRRFGGQSRGNVAQTVGRKRRLHRQASNLAVQALVIHRRGCQLARRQLFERFAGNLEWGFVSHGVRML